MNAYLIHGAGGGSWEWMIWDSTLKVKFHGNYLRLNAIDLIPNANGLENTFISYYIDQVFDQIDKFNDFILIGASMGAIIALKIAEILKPKALILVCSAIPKDLIVTSSNIDREIISDIPSIVKWSEGEFCETSNALTDSYTEAQIFAHRRWKDESGHVMKEISNGISVDYSLLHFCPKLLIIPEEDECIPADNQQLLAKLLKADSFRYAGMSHVGPLLSTRATEVAADVFEWIARRLPSLK